MSEIQRFKAGYRMSNKKSKYDAGIIFSSLWLLVNHAPQELISELLTYNDLHNADVSDYDGYGAEFIDELNSLDGVELTGTKEAQENVAV